VVLGRRCGKSVLMRMLAGLERPDGDTSHGMAAARPAGASPWCSSSPCCCAARWPTTRPLGLKPLRLSRNCYPHPGGRDVGAVGLAHRAADPARHLSGGERQRPGPGRAWAVRPRLLLLDEPTAALDPPPPRRVEQIVREIRTDGAKIVMTTHNLGQAMRIPTTSCSSRRTGAGTHALARFFPGPQSHEARLSMQGEIAVASSLFPLRRR